MFSKKGALQWIHCQATLLFAMASVAAIISSVIHSSEVFEPFAFFFCKCACLCVEGEIPKGWDNGFQCGEETLKPCYDTTNPTYLEWKWNFVCAKLLLRPQHQNRVNHIIKCYFNSSCGEQELKVWELGERDSCVYLYRKIFPQFLNVLLNVYFLFICFSVYAILFIFLLYILQVRTYWPIL